MAAPRECPLAILTAVNRKDGPGLAAPHPTPLYYLPWHAETPRLELTKMGFPKLGHMLMLPGRKDQSGEVGLSPPPHPRNLRTAVTHDALSLHFTE